MISPAHMVTLDELQCSTRRYYGGSRSIQADWSGNRCNLPRGSRCLRSAALDQNEDLGTLVRELRERAGPRCAAAVKKLGELRPVPRIVVPLLAEQIRLAQNYEEDSVAPVVAALANMGPRAKAAVPSLVAWCHTIGTSSPSALRRDGRSLVRFVPSTLSWFRQSRADWVTRLSCCWANGSRRREARCNF